MCKGKGTLEEAKAKQDSLEEGVKVNSHDAGSVPAGTPGSHALAERGVAGSKTRKDAGMLHGYQIGLRVV